MASEILDRLTYLTLVAYGYAYVRYGARRGTNHSMQAPGPAGDGRTQILLVSNSLFSEVSC